jgi:hypothetical protein
MMLEEEFRTYGADDPAVRKLRGSMPNDLFALAEHVLGRWQQAGMPLRPAGRGFALQAPHGDRLTTVAWVYGPDRRRPLPRIEVAPDLLRRREIEPEHVEALRDDLTRFPTHEPNENSSMIELPIKAELSLEDMDRLVRVLVQFGLSLA